MNEATVSILINAKDQASGTLENVKNTLISTGQTTEQTSRRADVGFKGLGGTLASSKAAIRELAMGVGFLGGTFLSLGIAMKQSNSEMGQVFGNTLLIVGAIMTSIASFMQFISAIAKVINALKALIAVEIIQKAFQGPAGWAAIAIGAGVAAGATMMATRKVEAAAGSVTNNYHISGSVVTEKQLSDITRRETVKTQQRNYTSGIR